MPSLSSSYYSRRSLSSLACSAISLFASISVSVTLSDAPIFSIEVGASTSYNKEEKEEEEKTTMSKIHL